MHCTHIQHFGYGMVGAAATTLNSQRSIYIYAWLINTIPIGMCYACGLVVPTAAAIG